MIKFNTFCKAALGAAAVVSASYGFGQTYTLHFHPKPGAIHYVMSMHSNTSGASTQGMKMKMNMAMTVHIKNAGHGTYRLVTSLDKMNMTMNGKPMPSGTTDALKKQSFTTIMDSNGKILNVEGGGGASQMFQGFANPDMFNKPFKVGKVVSQKMNMNGMNTGVSLRFDGVKSVGGHHLAQFTVTKMTMGGMGGMQMHIVGKPHLVIDADTGMTRSMNMQMSMTMQGTSSQISVTMDAK